jgi:hypothetical protein
VQVVVNDPPSRENEVKRLSRKTKPRVKRAKILGTLREANEVISLASLINKTTFYPAGIAWL